MEQNIVYKIAATDEEFNQIHRLNYDTFVGEIPQHEANDSQQLLDKFHDENTYVIAKLKEEVIGMIAVRGTRPFSLDHKLSNVDDYLETGASPCEIRLLSVKKAYRKRTTFFGLIDQLANYCLDRQYDIALISGTDQQLALYKKLGFEKFADRVGSEKAGFYPMKLTKINFVKATQAYQRILARYEPISFLSGPVPMEKEVAQSLSIEAQSHRSPEFLAQMQKVQSLLRDKTNADYASVLVGTGTLANDVVAQQIKQLPGQGLVLANGEFGERLIDHAERAGLRFHTIQKEWNMPISIDEIRFALEKDPSISWIWTVHCETSTGFLYDLQALKQLKNEYDVHLCLDACSSLGVDEVDLEDIYLASSVSGKGLGAYPGLAIVFHAYHPSVNRTIPRYLDLGLYASAQSTPFTHSYNYLIALKKGLELGLPDKQEWMETLRSTLKRQGWSVLGASSYSNGIVTVEIPDDFSSITVGDDLKKQGILINYESAYLRKRNWIQIALMGCISEVELTRLLHAMNRLKETKMKGISS